MSRIKFNVITIALAAVLCIALVFALGFGVNGGTIATAGGLDNTGIDNGGSSIIDKGDIGGGLISGGGDEDDKTIDTGGGSLIDKGDIGGGGFVIGGEDETSAAKIGDVKYDTIEEALSAANNNDKIYLLKNVALSEDVTISKYLDVYAGGFTFDLCGKKVVGSDDGIRLDFFENVTIKDSSLDKSGAFDCGVKFYLPESGHVIMGGTFNKYTTFSSLMTVKGGVFKSNVELPSNNNGNIKFYGGTFEKGIFKNGYEFADLIGSGCEYRDIQTSAVINVSELKNSVPFKVVCDHTWASGVCSNCGYVCLHENRNGTTCSDCESTLIVKIENSTATRYFSSITSAFSALTDGDTIIVLNDFTMIESVQTGKNVTFDLNGKKITANINGSPVLKFNGKTTVKDSSANKTGEVNTWIQVECKVALGADETYCCYVESGYFSHMIQFGSNTLITGGTYSYASPSMDATNVKVEGGTFNVVDGESQFSVDSKSLTISGGTFNSRFVVAVSPTSITITGGTFAEIYIPGTENNGVELHLSGGTFDSISAGPYNYADFLAEGYVYQNVETSEVVAPENMSANIKVAVVECPHANANNGDNGLVCSDCEEKIAASVVRGGTTLYFTSLEDAFKAVKSGETIALERKIDYTNFNSTAHESIEGCTSVHVTTDCTLEYKKDCYLNIGDSVSIIVDDGVSFIFKDKSDQNLKDMGIRTKIENEGVLTVDGKLYESVTNRGNILRGEFYGDVYNYGKVTDGSFYGVVYNSSVVTGGTFVKLKIDSAKDRADCYISGGRYTYSGGSDTPNIEFFNSSSSTPTLPSTGGGLTLPSTSGGNELYLGKYLADGYAFYNISDDSLCENAYVGAGLYDVYVASHTHSFIEGKCACGFACSHDGYWNIDENGVCSYCGYHCKHSDVSGNYCSDCGNTLCAKIERDNVVSYYVKFEDALEAIEDGDTLTLLEDITISGEKRIGDSVTIDLNGKTIYGDDNSNLNLLYFCGNTSHKILVIKNSASTVGKIKTKVETMFFDTSVTGNVVFEDDVDVDGGFIVSGGNNGFKNLRIMGNNVTATFTDAFTVSDTLTLTNATTTINSSCNIAKLVVGDCDNRECSLTIIGASVGTLTLKKCATSVKLADGNYTNIILDGTSLTYADLLAEGYAYKLDSNFVAPTEISESSNNIKVKICDAHSWSDGVCDYCLKECLHSGGAATCKDLAICTVCGMPYGDLDDNNHVGEQEWIKDSDSHSKYWTCCNASIVAEENHEWHDGVCTECNYVCEHNWIDGACGYCGKNCEHNWENGVCTICEKVCAHSGGTATCKDYAICDVCGLTYGDYDKNNHVGEQEWITTETTHKKTMNCCGDTIIPEEDHEWHDGVCTECNYVCEHNWIDGACGYCGKNCEHDWENGVCTICEKVCAHTGGTATCIEKAICEICGEEYGAYDENCHAHLVEVKATASTVTTAGNIAHYHCTDCDKRFSDVLAINEVTLESVALPKLPPAVVSGGEGKYVKNSGESLTVKSNALLSDFVAVYVDGKEISSDNYVLGEDGLSVKFKSVYLDSCEVGTHEVSLRSISGNADTTFTIESAPDEGLSGGAWAGIGIAIAAAVIGAMIGIMLVAKKRG